MRALIKLSLLLLLLSPLAVAAVIWSALSAAPLVTQQATLSHQDIARAKDILHNNDPRYLPAGTSHTLDIGHHDLDLAANYLLQRLARGNARLDLQTDLLHLQMTLQLPHVPFRNHLNVEAGIAANAGRPQIASLQIGSLHIPAPLAVFLVRRAAGLMYDEAQMDSAVALLQDVRIMPDRLRLTYQWNPVMLEQARDSLLTHSDREALRFYHDRLIHLQSRGVGLRGSVTDLLSAMFAEARDRSRDHSPVGENIALLTVLGTWASGHNINRLVPGSTRRPKAFRLKIERRMDFAQHFLASAALAARGDSVLSDAVGLFKEISDTDRGSGFSFTDIAADRAGTRFGELAARSVDDARRVQALLADGVSDTDLVPPVRDLPEHLDTHAFQAQFQYVGSPAYQDMMREIEHRIDATRLYRD